MTDFTTLENRALSAELTGNWLHAADLWRQASTVAVSMRLRKRCIAFELEAREQADRTGTGKQAVA